MYKCNLSQADFQVIIFKLILSDEEVRVTRGGFKPKSNDGGYLFARGYGKRQDTANEGTSGPH